MTNPVLIIRILLFLLFTGFSIHIAAAAPLCQSSRKQPTPDPYFNPSNVSQAEPNSPATGSQSKSLNPLKPIPGWQSPASALDGNGSRGPSASKSDFLAVPAPPLNPQIKDERFAEAQVSEPVKTADSINSVWEAPKTPVAVTANIQPLANPHSIIRERRLPETPAPQPLGPLALSPQTLDSPAMKPKNEPSIQSGGEFSADLLGLKRQSATQPAPSELAPQPTTPNSQRQAEFVATKVAPPADQTVKSLLPRGSRYDLGSSETTNQTTPPTKTTPNRVPQSNPFQTQRTNVSTTLSRKSPAPEFKPFEPTRLLAMVGNEPVFVGDLLFEVNQLVEKFMPTAPQSVKEEEGQKLIPRLLPKFVDAKMLYLGALQTLPEGADLEKIIEQAGKEFDDKAMKKMIESAGLKSPTELDAQLRAQGSSLRKMRLFWSQDQLTKYFLSQQLNVDTEISHQAMLDDYHQRISEYEVPTRAKWEQIMIRFDRSSSAAEAKEKIVELGNQIVYGANLASVAKNSSHGFRAVEGGQHDWTSKDALVFKELDNAIFTLPIGELSDVIETNDGYHIVRVIERNEATHKPFLEAQVEIKSRLQDEKRDAAFKKHLEKLRDQIRVEYFDAPQ